MVGFREREEQMIYLHFKGQVLRHRAKADEMGLEDCCGQSKSVTERTVLLYSRWKVRWGPRIDQKNGTD